MSPLSWTLNSVGLVAAIILLWKGADLFVDAASRIARRFGLSDLVIGLTLVACGTSAPEFAVTIGAALSGKPDISVANVVGSNIFNLGLILGGCAAIRPVLTGRNLVFRDGIVLIAATALLALFVQDLRFGRLEGTVLVGLLVAYLLYLFFRKEPLEEMPDESSAATWKDIPIILLTLLMILGGAHLLVESATALALGFGISEWAIGVTVVAAGTSAPELVTALNAVLKNRHGIGAGSLLGSDLFNLLGVLGVAALIHPLDVAATAPSSIYVLVGMVVVVVLFMRSGWRISRTEGFVLVGVNLVRWWYEIWGVG